MGIDRRIMMSRVMNGEWSPRAVMHEFIETAKARGATMVLLGRLMEISKQAIAQWSVVIKNPAIHIERHALDYLMKISEIPEMDRPLIIADQFTKVTKILEKASAMEPIPSMVEATSKENSGFMTIQIWAPEELIKRVNETAKTNFGCKKFFFSWAMREFIDKQIFAMDSFIFRQPRTMKASGIAGGLLYVQIDEKTNERCLEEAKKLDIPRSAFLMEGISWGATHAGAQNA